jgi:hypothetical protein
MSNSIGWIYVLQNKSMPGLVKIGFTMDDPWERANQLSTPTAVPQPFEVFFATKTSYPAQVEKWLHENTFRNSRVSPHREFFVFDVRSPSLLYYDEPRKTVYNQTEEQKVESFIQAIKHGIREAVAWHKSQEARQRYEQVRLRNGYEMGQLSWKHINEVIPGGFDAIKRLSEADS